MSIKYDHVTIRLSELQTKTVIVAPWETPLLQAMYGDEAEVTGHSDIDRSAPEANDEFNRLATRYGPKNAETPIVAAVYGKFGPGVAKLNSEINRACGMEVGPAATSEHGVVTPTLTDEQIDAISDAGDVAQTKIIPVIEPNPPLVSKNPAVEDASDLV